MNDELLHQGRHLQLRSLDGWEYATRHRASGVVVIVAFTPDDELLLVEQHRPPVGCRVLELPAGLAGDHAGSEDEPLVEAAKRELVEETGYSAADWVPLGDGPSSAGLTDETVRFFLATGLSRVGEGGGDESEDIEVLRVPRQEIRAFLTARRETGVLVDPKLAAGLWMAAPHLP